MQIFSSKLSFVLWKKEIMLQRENIPRFYQSKVLLTLYVQWMMLQGMRLNSNRRSKTDKQGWASFIFRIFNVVMNNPISTQWPSCLTLPLSQIGFAAKSAIFIFRWDEREAERIHTDPSPRPPGTRWLWHEEQMWRRVKRHFPIILWSTAGSFFLWWSTPKINYSIIVNQTMFNNGAKTGDV